MKLYFATDSYPYGNAEKSFLLEELKGLAKQYEVTVISHADEAQQRKGIDPDFPEGIECRCFGRPVISSLDKIKAVLTFPFDRDGRWEIREILSDRSNKNQAKERLYQSLAFFAQMQADRKQLKKSGLLDTTEEVIYYSFWYTYFCYSAIRLKGNRKNIRVITRAHGYDLYHERIPGNRQPFRHQMEKKLEKILFVCQHTHDYYEKKVKDATTDLHKLAVSRLGVKATEYCVPQRESDVFALLSCSNVIPLKRIEKIIDGLALIQEQKIQWTHIGDGESMAFLQKYAREKLGDKQNISWEFPGAIDNTKVHEYYRTHQVDAFITTSSTEGCPVTLQEAMAYSVPIIGTAVGGITEMIDQNGVLLSADPDEREVATAIERICNLDRKQTQDMKEAAFVCWQKEYDTDVNVKKLLTEISSLN